LIEPETGVLSIAGARILAGTCRRNVLVQKVFPAKSAEDYEH
jgi:hypothetical protein